MGNSTLLYGATEKEKEEYLKSEYWQEYVRMGYKLVIAPSFFHPEFLAVYVVNWEDPRVINEGYPGIIRYSVTFNQSHETKGPLL